MKKTPWYPGTVKPVRKGWYECMSPIFYEEHIIQMDWWNGNKWCAFADTDGAYGENDQNDWKWRGVAK